MLWPAEWTIENVIGWIAEAGGNAILQQLSAVLGFPISNFSTFVTLLKTPPPGGRKGDQVAYELFIAALADNAACLQRLRDLLKRMANACAGEANPAGWTREATSTAGTAILRFVP